MQADGSSGGGKAGRLSRALHASQGTFARTGGPPPQGFSQRHRKRLEKKLPQLVLLV